MRKTVKKDELKKIVDHFQRLFGCDLCMHLYSPIAKSLFNFIPFYHCNQTCVALKKDAGSKSARCITFDLHYVQNRLKGHAQPFFKRCHLGVFEGVFPVHMHNSLVAVFFVGPFKWVEDELAGNVICQDGAFLVKNPGTIDMVNKLPKLDNEKMALVNTFASILMDYFNCFLEQQSINQINSTLNRQETIAVFIENNYKYPFLSLDHLAEHLNLSVSHTSRSVKKLFGDGFNKLLSRKRVEAASDILKTTNYPCHLIAEWSGFLNTDYFYHVFKKHFSLTPSEYRDKFKQQ